MSTVFSHFLIFFTQFLQFFFNQPNTPHRLNIYYQPKSACIKKHALQDWPLDILYQSKKSSALTRADWNPNFTGAHKISWLNAWWTYILKYSFEYKYWKKPAHQRKLSKGTSQKASALNEVFSSLASATLFVKRKRGDADNFLWLSGLFLICSHL